MTHIIGHDQDAGATSDRYFPTPPTPLIGARHEFQHASRSHWARHTGGTSRTRSPRSRS